MINNFNDTLRSVLSTKTLADVNNPKVEDSTGESSSESVGIIDYLRNALFPSIVKTGNKEVDTRNALSAFLDALGKLFGGTPVQNAGFENDAEKIEQTKIPKAPSFKYPDTSAETETWIDGDGNVVRGIRDPQQMIKFKEVQKIQPLLTPNNLKGGRGF